MSYLIKEATPAWAAYTTAKLLAKAGIVPTASKYGSKVVKAYKNMQARGTLANELATTPSKNIPAHFEELIGRNMFHPHVPTSKLTNRQGITISRAGANFPVLRNVKTVRGTNGEEYLKAYKSAKEGPIPRLNQSISTKVTGDPVLDSVALARATSRASTNLNLAKNYKGRLINSENIARLNTNDLGMSDDAFKTFSSMLDDGTNAMWESSTNSVWMPNKMQGAIFDNMGGSSVVSPGVGRKMVLDHENLGHRMMGGVLTPNQANAATQRYYWAMKRLNKALGYKPVTSTRAVLEGVDQARAYANSNIVRLGENRFFANADRLNNVNIPTEEVKALRDITKQQVFGPNTNISDELFEAARSGLLHMRRNYRQLALR